MNASLLTEIIEIYSVPTLDSDYGTNRPGTPVFKSSTHAHIIFNSENRLVSEGEVFFPTDRLMIVRHYVDVNERDRIKWNNKWWNIISINANKYYNNKEIRVTLQNK